MAKKADLLEALNPYADLNQEHFICITLDSKHRIIGTHMVFKGTVSSVIFHPREILKAAIDDLAVAIIVAHNHPSGVTNPSYADMELTQQLVAAGQLVGIALHDHIVFSGVDYFSFLAHGYLDPAPIKEMEVMK